MAKTLISAISTLLKLQRWNIMPRVETWTEAENIAYTTHIVYAMGKTMSFKQDELEHAVKRALLKSINKHCLTDIPVDTRDCIKEIDTTAWIKLINDAAKETSDLFPRYIAAKLKPYMTYNGEYEVKGAKESEIKEKIENLITYAQYISALEELDANARVYGDAYIEKKKDLNKKLKKLKLHSQFDKAFKSTKRFIHKVRNLKYLRRWNRINRSVESSVMGHTFVVALLALMFVKISNEDGAGADGCKVYQVLLRALFHDIPETFTGDIITPVKRDIDKVHRGMMDAVEAKMQSRFFKTIPTLLKSEMEEFGLAKELKEDVLHSVDSLVKSCDRLGIVLEYLFETEAGGVNAEMIGAYNSYMATLRNCEWPCIREFCVEVSLEYPRR